MEKVSLKQRLLIYETDTHMIKEFEIQDVEQGHRSASSEEKDLLAA